RRPRSSSMSRSPSGTTTTMPTATITPTNAVTSLTLLSGPYGGARRSGEEIRMSVETNVEANLAAVRARVAEACRAAGRAPEDVQVLLATKTVPADRIAVAVRAGARLIGENRVQELAEKDAELAGLPCERHFIGHLQTNKVNQVLRYVSCIQSVDSVDLADRLQRRLERLDGTVDVLIQVNTSGEASKFGLAPGDAL